MATESSTATVLTADEPVMLALWCLGSLLVAATLVPASKYIQQDYHEFLSLGPGGTPSTIPGYLRIKALSCFALRDRYRPPPVPKHEQRPHGYLSSLPARNRPRPETRGIAPHRQVTQTVTAEVYDSLDSAVHRLANRSDGRLVMGKSCFEKHSIALFSTSPVRRTCRGEIAHAHPSDGSMHLTLGVEDAKMVLSIDGEIGSWKKRDSPGWIEST
ncbi:uncharacterized protein MYCGRDRAFT_66678 [Zymoseptoria tritici IPO323]|uniref:Luciferase domain-containing protein n=1 Tax=Zymoseptoria tritici (strain CBS 115943 / IPO323) TaxID=336722 RepID=F9X191_ZYMTI|nr:uncharacterized protein MYCGRDRAFT_66678 [Zymoseptoria tritici IPO323]EGP91452.1 hypothetical protein MYCGRDRAFT_66678 [Zymoseptoria tritici IPO323]